jgi:hypothetical protein
MKYIYTFINEPNGKTYTNLIRYSLKFCSSFLLILRPSVLIESSGLKIINELQPYLIKKSVESEWPGTKLLGNDAVVYNFKLNSETVEFLTYITSSLYSWLQPNLPEDLCLLTDEGDPWLVTISHEKDGYLRVSDEEKENIIKEIPELVLKKSEYQ